MSANSQKHHEDASLKGSPFASLRPALQLRLFSGDKAYGPGIDELLCCIEETGSLRSAAGKMGMAYSKAWTILRHCEENLGLPLLLRSTGGKEGGGAKLTKNAKKLHSLYQELQKEVQENAEQTLRELLLSHFPPEEA